MGFASYDMALTSVSLGKMQSMFQVAKQNCHLCPVAGIFCTALLVSWIKLVEDLSVF